MSLNETTWKDKRVLVTGGAGFVGRWLCKALQLAGAEIHLLDMATPGQSENSLIFHRTDLCNLEATHQFLAELRPPVIIHLAGQPGVQWSHSNPVAAFDSNVTATFNLLEAARIVNCAEAIVVITSAEIISRIVFMIFSLISLELLKIDSEKEERNSNVRVRNLKQVLAAV